MKSLSIILVIALLSSVNLNAQKKKTYRKSTKPNVEFGVKAGGNASTVKGHDITYTYKNKFGYYAGFLIKYPLTSSINLKAELVYAMLGTKISKDDNGEQITANLNMSYVTLPLMAQFQISPEFYIEAGPEFAYNVSSKIRDNQRGEVVDWQQYTKKFHVSLGTGVGYYFTKELAVNFRANFGMTTPFIESENGTVAHFRMNNFQLGLNYFFK